LAAQGSLTEETWKRRRCLWVTDSPKENKGNKTSEEQLERTGLETCSAVVVAVKEGKNE
jgi:hypothetical protein